MNNSKITYEDSGVEYDNIDPFKIAAQQAAAATSNNTQHLSGIKPVANSRGESVFLVETENNYIAHIEETLGTKTLVADAMRKLTNDLYYGAVAQDTVAAIINDLIQLGALPVSIAMHLAVGKSDWFMQPGISQDLISGWKKACDLAEVVWGGGETPTLNGVIEPETLLLSGSAVGIIQDKSYLISGNIAEGDAIIMIESSGIHTNGVSLTRSIADKLPEGYLTKLPDGKNFGEHILIPSFIYTSVIRECQEADIFPKYTSHITGHGWRKIMRHENCFIYNIEEVLPIPPIFPFVQEHAKLSDREMFETFNMGTGYMIIASKNDAEKIIQISKSCGFEAIIAGMVTKNSDKKEVVINPHGITFDGSELHVR